jgi:hypothetical protein
VALTAAERQQRSRAHKRGDHSACDPARCPDVTLAVTTVTPADVTPDVTDPVLEELGPRGQRLYRDVLAEHKDLGARERVVLEEAARTADRCEQLDRLLRGDERVWARVYVPERGTTLELVVDKTMGEARQQQTTLARLLSELRQHLAPAATKEPTAPIQTVQQSGGAKLGDLTARIAARRNPAPAG